MAQQQSTVSDIFRQAQALLDEGDNALQAAAVLGREVPLPGLADADTKGASFVKGTVEVTAGGNCTVLLPCPDRVTGAEGYRVQTRWRLVSCAVQGPVRYRIKEGSSADWTAIQVRNHLLPIKKLEWEKSGTWVEVTRQPYNYFVEPSGMGAGPIRVRVTATDGQQLEDTLPQVIQATIVIGAAQFAKP